MEPTADGNWLLLGCSKSGRFRGARRTCASVGSLAAVRCCSISNSGVVANVREANKTSCTSICSALDAGRGQHTYSMPKLNVDGLAANLTEAKAECRAVAGRRLCSREELLAGVCCKTGCGMDTALVWTSSACPGPGRLHRGARRPRWPSATDRANARLKDAVCSSVGDGVRIGSSSRSSTINNKNNLSSPDPFCGVRLSKLQGRASWLLRLPVFHRKAQLLAARAWHRYLRGVYGELGERDFPIDVRCFLFFYAEELPADARRSMVPHVYDAARQRTGDWSGLEPGHVLDFTGASGCAWFVFLHAGASIDPLLRRIGAKLLVDPSAIRIGQLFAADADAGRRNYLQGAFASNTRVEIYHQYDDCGVTGNGTSEIGYWAHYAPGSGVFADLGRTVVTGGAGYGDAVRHLANGRRRADGQSAHDALFRIARRAGYDSVQSCCGERGGTRGRPVFEMSFYGTTCKGSEVDPAVGACPAFLSAGRSLRRRCNCRVDSFPTTRCSSTIGQRRARAYSPA